MPWRPIKGAGAENKAAQWCQRQGWKLLARNYRVKGGEIDLICLDGSALVFVEVRERKSNRYGGAAASITQSKQRKLILAAQLYLQDNPAMARRSARFDVLTLGEKDGINWIKSAFST